MVTSQKVLRLRGVKQGCPLSPYLFIMSIEMLAIKMRSNKNSKGLETLGIKTKVSMYAHDSNFSVNPQSGSLHSIIEESLSGLKSNYDKCPLKMGRW